MLDVLVQSIKCLKGFDQGLIKKHRCAVVGGNSTPKGCEEGAIANRKAKNCSFERLWLQAQTPFEWLLLSFDWVFLRQRLRMKRRQDVTHLVLAWKGRFVISNICLGV